MFKHIEKMSTIQIISQPEEISSEKEYKILKKNLFYQLPQFMYIKIKINVYIIYYNVVKILVE